MHLGFQSLVTVLRTVSRSFITMGSKVFLAPDIRMTQVEIRGGNEDKRWHGGWLFGIDGRYRYIRHRPRTYDLEFLLWKAEGFVGSQRGITADGQSVVCQAEVHEIFIVVGC